MNVIELRVPGMSCGHCETAVSEELKKVPGVRRVSVDLATKVVVVHGEQLDRAALVAAVEEAGYDPDD